MEGEKEVIDNERLSALFATSTRIDPLHIYIKSHPVLAALPVGI